MYQNQLESVVENKVARDGAIEMLYWFFKIALDANKHLRSVVAERSLVNLFYAVRA